jgi:hypothetical protein
VEDVSMSVINAKDKGGREAAENRDNMAMQLTVLGLGK